ncbi:hypothetical protein BH09BAC2_BH09BAC2_15920 [soil metagenome]
MSEIKLSYVITTFNKLLYLKEVMRLLLQNIQADEEIVIADGGSTDGTKEYLQKLYEEGLIHQFISEKDSGEAHGYNKTFFMARGELIKIITDDDVFNYDAVRRMKEFMLINHELAAMTGNIISVNTMQSSLYLEFRKSYEVWFRRWINNDMASCFFSCLPLMIRKNKLSLIGLLDTSYKHVDLEFSVRLTALQMNLAFYTDIVAIGLVNPQSISASAEAGKLIAVAQKRLNGNYNFIDERGIKDIYSPYAKKVIDKIPVIRNIANRLKLFSIRTEFYPEHDIVIEKDIHLNQGSPKVFFEYFENKLQHMHQEKIFLMR